MEADIAAHYRWIETVCVAAVKMDGNRAGAQRAGPDLGRVKHTLTEQIDAILIHKVYGLFFFAIIMGTVFAAIFWVAKPLMDLTNYSILAFGKWATVPLAEGALKSLIRDGVFAGAGTVVAFVPQIALLFTFLALLEDSGYFARAAFLMDLLLAKVGLHGKSFIPLMSSFACAIPGILATRTIENRRDRLATILVAPFMSCSARLPVYSLLITTLFAAKQSENPFHAALRQTGIMLGCYGLGIFAAAATAWVFKRSLLKHAPASFIMELPSYKLPQAQQVVREVYRKSASFVMNAGSTILAFSVVLWALAYYPRQPRDAAPSFAVQTFPAPVSESGHTDDPFARRQQEFSFAGRIGHFMEPVIKPLGFDWKMGVGLLGAFAARETFISTMGVTYAIDAESDSQSLADAMLRDRKANGESVWTPLVALSLLVWFVLALQCMSTVAIARRETGGWYWPMVMLLYMNVLAYVMSLIVYQSGLVLGYQ
jgi:ferrous iron transport protein B